MMWPFSLLHKKCIEDINFWKEEQYNSKFKAYKSQEKLKSVEFSLADSVNALHLEMQVSTKLRKQLAELDPKEYQRSKGYADHLVSSRTHIMDKIKADKIPEYNPWTKVADLLPKTHQTVLVYGYNPAAENSYYVSQGCCLGNKENWLILSRKGHEVYMVGAKVSHWRPMPSKP